MLYYFAHGPNSSHVDANLAFHPKRDRFLNRLDLRIPVDSADNGIRNHNHEGNNSTMIEPGDIEFSSEAPDFDMVPLPDELPSTTNWQVDAVEPLVADPTDESEERTSLSDAARPAPTPVRILEALFFVGGPPLTAARAGEIIRSLTDSQFVETIGALNQEYRRQGRPYEIQPLGLGYALTLRSRYRPMVEKLFGAAREARLSTSSIDVLALVAYRQPTTKQEVDGIRGAESGAILRQLVRRGLIAVVQRGEAAQPEVAYGTTPRFLELFNLASLEDLPQTQDLQKL